MKQELFKVQDIIWQISLKTSATKGMSNVRKEK